MWDELRSLGTAGLGEGGTEVSEEKTPRMSKPKATSQRARAMARTVTNMREGREEWWVLFKEEVRCRGLSGVFLPRPLLLSRGAASIGHGGGESGGNLKGIWSVARC